jgi:hypothetical protein
MEYFESINRGLYREVDFSGASFGKTRLRAPRSRVSPTLGWNILNQFIAVYIEASTFLVRVLEKLAYVPHVAECLRHSDGLF